MTERTVAIIGLGIMGRRMLEHMVIHPGFRPVSLWDPDSGACAAALALAPDATVAGSADAAIQAADIVYLACPPAPRKALRSDGGGPGQDGFLEKPLGVDVAESRDLVARLQGVDAAVNFTQAAGSALAEVRRAAGSGEMGAILGADIVVTYAKWPRAWQAEADWLRFRAEGGYVREVISHFLFFTGRVLGPLKIAHAHTAYPGDAALCETHVLARLTAERTGTPIAIFGSVGGAQPDRQEVAIKGARRSYRIAEFHQLWMSEGEAFSEVQERPADPRAQSLRLQLDELAKCADGAPNLLATPAEALAVQELVEGILASN